MSIEEALLTEMVPSAFLPTHSMFVLVIVLCSHSNPHTHPTPTPECIDGSKPMVALAACHHRSKLIVQRTVQTGCLPLLLLSVPLIVLHTIPSVD